ncbi:hypothetical protein DY000_02062081 [Brassica cretica]|uniref:Uncharacterized protein n=1 Tax=Brassica cretica TaxID=69181 RepID=A0ABQ7B3Q3_BRACR|nr:hypothetical protein DY000_02062081 [Brassica cretica]
MFDEDEKRVRNGDRPFTKAKRNNCDVLDRNELQTYASLEKILHKKFFSIQLLKKKGNTNTSSAPKQQYPLPLFDDYTHEPMAGLTSCEHKNLFSSQSESILDESCLQLNILQPENPNNFELISQFKKDSENVLNKDEFCGPLNAFDISAYDLGLGSFVLMQEGPDEEQNHGHQTNQERCSSFQKPDQAPR